MAQQHHHKKNHLYTQFDFEHLLSMMPGHVYWADKNNVYLGCNNEQAECLCLEHSNDIAGKTSRDFFDQKTADIINKKDMEVMQRGHVVITEETVVWPNGKKGTYLSNKVPLFNAQNEVVGLLGISVDITKQKKLEQALRKEKNKVELTYQHEINFVRNMEHDIRTPFNSLLSALRLWHDIETDLEKKEIILVGVKSAERLLDFCNNIVSFGQSQLKGMPKREKKFDLFNLIESVIEMQKIVSMERSLTLKYEIEKNVPHYVIGDCFAIESTLVSLLSNAI